VTEIENFQKRRHLNQFSCQKHTHARVWVILPQLPAEGAVPPVVAPAVVAHPDIHAVLAICGFANAVDRTLIINNEGFQSIADFGVLKD
jgi:hypothetical protein